MKRSGLLPSNFIAVGTALVCWSCSTDASIAPTVTKHDSAGVEIVETTLGTQTAVPGWTVEREPRLTIGSVEGAEPYLFSRIAGAARLADGSILVADGQSGELRYFSATGEFLRTRGGSGEGPEEFGRLDDLERCGTNVYAFDRTPPEVSVWDAAGNFLRSFDLVEPGTNRGPFGTDRLICADDGSLVIVGWGESMSGRYRGQTAVFEDHAAVWVLDTVGQLVRELGEFPTSQRLSLVNPSGGGGIVTPPLGRMTVMELDTGRVFIGTAESLEVREYHRAGPLQRIMRVLNEDLAADEAFVDEVAAADPTGLQTQILTRIREQGLPLPERVPAYTAMRMDDDGYLWVKRFSLPSDTTSTWGVFAPDGSYAGHVTLPATLQVLDIGSTYILGVSTNDLDVEQVQLHRLIRGPLVGATGARH